MDINYRPKLRTVFVPLDDLLLDPNNPRFLTKSEDFVPEGQVASSGEQIRARDRMDPSNDEFRVDELVESIVANGWNPVDMIFVKALQDDGGFLVLEGNRRVTALRKLRDTAAEKNLAERWAEIRPSVDPLEVMEIIDDDDPATVAAKITYLLGVRHHGSLKTWSPFAQAHNMYERYLRIADQSDDSFELVDECAKRVAEILSIPAKVVEERLQVYRVMKQIDQIPEVNEIGMQGRYYSICQEVLQRAKRRNSPFKGYIDQDLVTLLLSEESLERMNTLCHFSKKGRSGAPVSNPKEWRALSNILSDEDSAKRAEMIRRVEVEKHRPTDVYAERAAELRQPRWDMWLMEVAQLLRTVPIDVEANDDAIAAATRLDMLLRDLEQRT